MSNTATLSNSNSSGSRTSITTLWSNCLEDLEHEMEPKQFNTWIRPLHAVVQPDERLLRIQAPNRWIQQWVSDKFLTRIQEIVSAHRPQERLTVEISAPGPSAQSNVRARSSGIKSEELTGSAPRRNAINTPADLAPRAVDSHEQPRQNNHHTRAATNLGREPIVPKAPSDARPSKEKDADHTPRIEIEEIEGGIRHAHSLIPHYTFDDFVEGKSNQLARAAASQVAKGSGTSYNPLFLYGGVGLGKTHLMHAVGHELLKRKPNARVVYLHSERFVADMVKALQLNAINEFKRYYRSVDALLIDDIQFFADKDRSQEEFFHTFNALLEGNKQMILTCDRYPKEIKGLEERLKSRFGWGLTCAMDPPELETRVAIVNKKAEMENINIPSECAFFIASKVRSNVRELEGALKRIIAQAKFTNSPIDISLVKDSMRDLLAMQDRLVTIDNIQRTVAEYFRIKVSDLTSKRRSRSVARPRQIAMTLAKELTNHSLPEIGNDFGGRDHTTVLHACRKIKELREENADLAEDYQNLLRSLTT